MAKNYQVPYSRIGTIFGKEEEDVIIDILRNQRNLIGGDERLMFEKEFAAFVGVHHAISVNSCSAAFELLPHILDFPPGSEIISTSMTYQTTVQPYLTIPIKIRFCDIDKNSLSPGPKDIYKLMNSKTRGIYVTHYGGLMANMDEIMKIGREYGLVVVEDCSHAHGAKIRNQVSGSTADIGCFSLNPLKNMSALGHGGMITLNNDVHASILRRIRDSEPDADFIQKSDTRIGNYKQPSHNFFRFPKNSYTHECTKISFSGNTETMNELEAAVGRVQLKKLGKLSARRNQICEYLDNQFSGLSCLRLQEIPNEYHHAHHFYVLFLEHNANITRDELLMRIDDAGIEIQLRFFPLHLLPEWQYKGHKYGECPKLEQVWFEELIILPCYPSLTDTQVLYMGETIKKIIQEIT